MTISPGVGDGPNPDAEVRDALTIIDLLWDRAGGNRAGDDPTEEELAAARVWVARSGEQAPPGL